MIGAAVITEIGAYALGASQLFPDARCILDIGGQDTEVILWGSETPSRLAERLRLELELTKRGRRLEPLVAA